MKIALITLSGDRLVAHSELAQRWPDADVAEVPRCLLEEGSLMTRLREMRAEKMDVFAVMTDGLGWQYGQEALMYFGALAGASRSMILDGRGNSVSAKRGGLLATSPIRIANCFLRGRAAVRKAEARLAALEAIETAPRCGNDSGDLKVAYFRTTPSAGTVPGGATSHINGVANGFTGLGAEVEFVSNDRIAGIDHSQTNFHIHGTEQNVMPRASFEMANGLSFAESASKLVRAIKPSFIYERYSRFSLAGVAAALDNKLPLFLEYNGSEVWVGKHWDNTSKLELLERYERLNLGFATRIFVISAVEKDNLLQRGVPEKKIVVNPNGVDIQKFRPGNGGAEERKRLGISADETLAGFLGTFGQWHGVLALADAIALIPKGSRLKFLFVGDGRLRPEVEKRLAAADDLDRVIFSGSVAHERVPAMLDACDILLSPHVPLAEGTPFFGSPTKLFEYMAMGKGIVASRLGQIGEVLADGETGLLVEPGNIHQLAAAIQRLARDNDLLTRLGKASRAVAVERHTWTRNAERVLETYQSLS